MSEQKQPSNNETASTDAINRSTPKLTRVLSEISIENSILKNQKDNSDNILEEINSSRTSFQKRLISIFELPDSETLINEFPCYLIRLVTIPGWMFVTTNYICFYATLPGKKKGPHKVGYLSKKNHRTSPRTYRYYFELTQNILSWYTSAETKYTPLSSIDLKCITKIEESKTKKYGIRLTTSSHYHYTLIADSEVSQKEWLDELKKGVFVAQHTGNSVRIVLPLSKIVNVEKPSVFQFAANIKIKFQDDLNEACPTDEDYYFAFFPNIQQAYDEIIETWKKVSKDNMDKINYNKPNNVSSTSGTFLSFDSFLENISPAALPTMLLSKLINITNSTDQHVNTATTSPAEEQNELIPDEDSSPTNSKNQTSIFNRLSFISYSQDSNDKKKDDLISPVSPDTPSPSLATKFKRRSLFFNRSTGNIETPTNDNKEANLTGDSQQTSNVSNKSYDKNRFNNSELSQEQQKSSLSDDIVSNIIKPRPHSISSIPRPVVDSNKNQLHFNDTSNPTSASNSSQSLAPIIISPEEESSTSLEKPSDEIKTQRRKRGSSFNSIRHHISPMYLYNKLNHNNTPNALNNTTVNDQSADISLIQQSDQNAGTANEASKVRTHRARKMGSIFMNSTRNMLTPGNIDQYYQRHSINESHHRHPKGSLWLSPKIIKYLNEHAEIEAISDEDSDIENDSETEENISNLTLDYLVSYNHNQSPELLQMEQETMNDHLNTSFPMLLETEDVEASFKASFWRTLPYHGRIYITNNHFCFRSKILAGQQKLIVPWHDVIQVTKLKSRSYYLMYGMTMVVKDLTEEIYLDFSSLKLRDYCYSVCKLKANRKTILDTCSIISNKSHSRSMTSLLINREDHVTPPIEYNGPPLLTSASSLTKSFTKYKTPIKPLHITCLTIGSRGDVQPYVALCKELQKDGHTCRIATHPEYENWITQHNIEFRSIGGDPGDLMKLCIDNSFLSVSFIREGTKFFYTWFESLLQSAYDACHGTDLIIESPSAMIGVHMAEKLEIPYFRSMPFPFTRTTKFPHPFAVQSTAGGRIYNDMTYVMIDMALWAGTARYVNRFRRDVLKLPSTNLDRLELWKVPYIYSFSPTVVHPPKDWPDYIHCTGYWFLDNPDMKWKPDSSLLKFLDRTIDNRPIVYIGFGSIIVPDPVETTRVIVESVLKANVRAIICKGWSARVTASKPSSSHKKSSSVDDIEGIIQAEVEQEESSEILLNKYPDSIYHIDAIPHDWLFPQIQGAVHHGGAGTTAAGLRAGLPTIIKPFFGDQRFWGQRIEELQVGICINKLTVNQLLDALKKITQNTALIVKAQKLGETIRQENGPRNAVECIYRELEFAREQRVSQNL